MRHYLLAISILLGTAFSVSALTVKDSTLYNPSWVITWTDHLGKERKAALVQSGTLNGVCQFFSYYDGTTKVTIVPGTPATDRANAGFGASVHHYSSNSGTNVATTKLWQSASMAVFSCTQTVDAAPETNVYTFMDGHDYFQWSETVHSSVSTAANANNADNGNGTGGDSRGPYCTILWAGTTSNLADGVEFGALHYFKQPVLTGASYPTRTGPWTLAGTCDIPYAWEWASAKEIGYVATQTYTQNNAGNATWGASLNCPTSGATIDPSGNAWMFDYQMNFYDCSNKITWGMPYGYMNNDIKSPGYLDPNLNHTIKNGWGQYSLSILMDAKSDSGVMRIRDENRAIHNGSVKFVVIGGTIKDSVPVGTVNPNKQLASPLGYDHNYRAWWLTAANNAALCSLNVTGTTPLVNPTVRISSLSSLSLVSLNGTALVQNSGFYASRDTANNEYWITLNHTFNGKNILGINNATAVIDHRAQTSERGLSFFGKWVAGEHRAEFTFRAPSNGRVALAIYDQAGRLVAKVFEGRVSAGVNTMEWNASHSHLVKGLCIARLTIDGEKKIERTLQLSVQR